MVYGCLNSSNQQPLKKDPYMKSAKPIAGMSPVDIRIEMLKRGVSQSALARQERVRPVSIYRTIEGTLVSDRLRKAIANAIEKDIRLIWPDPYYYGDPRKPGRRLGQLRCAAA
jgi:lambda repressor-like predicted transcriptional regulator